MTPPDNNQEPKPVPPKEPARSIKINEEGTITCGSKRFRAEEESLRRDILGIIARHPGGHLPRKDYEEQLIDAHFKYRPRGCRLITEPYLRRQNNVDKAMSRLRQDLTNFFRDQVPEGTSWLCFSKRIDGWLLYRLPGLGCDGHYHW